MRNLPLLFLMLAVLHGEVMSGQNIEKSIQTVYPTKDWVISDFVVTDARFGAKAEPGFDNTSAFQAAIDAAYENGGGVVYIPAGNYGFYSTQTGQKLVRIRRGNAEEKKNFDYQYVLKLHPGVQLRGDWADPEECGGKVKGTVLEVRVGKDSEGYDRSVESWWNDSQAGNALRTSYTSVADRFIEMNAGTGVTNLSIWYPEQDIDDVRPYPWTLFQTSGDCATVEHVTLVNSYNGFYSAPSELHYVKDSYITALCKGVEIHVCTDIGRIENVKISPQYWSASGLPGAPSYEKLESYTKRNSLGFQMHRSDWEYISYLSVNGYKTGMWIGREPGFDNAPNAQLYGIDIQNCATGLYVQDVNPYGIMVSNSCIGASPGEKAVYFYNDFDTSVQFNGVQFTGSIVSDGSGGVVSFENCSFDRYDGYALNINSGNIILTQSQFSTDNNHLIVGEATNSIRAVNSGYGDRLSIENRSRSAEIDVVYDSRYRFEPIPSVTKTDIAIYPKPVSSAVLKADIPAASGFNNDIPETDVTEHLQSALDAVKEAGGGTLFLPAGRYLVNSPVTVPSGVELRGSWDVQHHTQSGGTAIFTRYTGGDKGKDGEPLIQLEENSGIKGLTIAQLNLTDDGYTIDNPRETPFLIQGRGKGVYIINVTIALGDKGIDLATYNTSGHYVDYLGGVLLRAGIWVGGGSDGGIIRNMQFNPHYSLRLPRGGQGYPKVDSKDFVQSHCSALKFADVKNQTIFNNFVFGSVYGIHFLRDAVTGKCPGEIEMIGHGSDGCTFALFVEDADRDTRITGINSELVNTRIVREPVRSYVLMGNEPSTDKVHPDAELILYNSAFWGSPVVGAIINNGIVKFRQANFCSPGNPAIDLRCGNVEVFSSYFPKKGNNNGNVHLNVGMAGCSAVFVNNKYGAGLKYMNARNANLKGPDFSF